MEKPTSAQLEEAFLDIRAVLTALYSNMNFEELLFFWLPGSLTFV